MYNMSKELRMSSMYVAQLIGTSHSDLISEMEQRMDEYSEEYEQKHFEKICIGCGGDAEYGYALTETATASLFVGISQAKVCMAWYLWKGTNIENETLKESLCDILNELCGLDKEI
jgi:hypothetical protein